MDDEMERERLEFEKERLDFERHRASFEAGHNFARDAIRNAILINGAAAIALLTFLGHDQANSVADTTALSKALLQFGFGVIAGAICSLLAYIYQTTERELRNWRWMNETLRAFAVVAGLAAIVFFFRGLWLASCAFT